MGVCVGFGAGVAAPTGGNVLVMMTRGVVGRGCRSTDCPNPAIAVNTVRTETGTKRDLIVVDGRVKD